MKRSISILFILSGISLLSSCTKAVKEGSEKVVSTDDLTITVGDIATSAGSLKSAVSQAYSEGLFNFDPSELSVDVASLAALTYCQCTPELNHQFTRRLSVAQGTLPQEMVPDIREQVRQERGVKVLLETKTPVRQILTAVFANNEKMKEAVLEGIFELLQKGLGYPINDSFVRYNYKLDAFKALPIGFDNEKLAEYDARRLDINTQSYLWRFSFSLGGFTDQSLGQGDASYYTLMQMVNTLIEWKYLFGIDVDSANRSLYGGLTFRSEGTVSDAFKPYDPRISGGAGRYVGGSMRISYPNFGRLELTLEGKEEWEILSPWTTLGEQARIWLSAAEALKVLRPRNRTVNPNMFSEEGLLPDNAHMLALLFLPGIRDLLANHFINEESRLIFETMKDENSRQKLASFGTLVNLADALQKWHRELDDIRDLDVKGELGDDLLDAPPALKQVLRVVVQAILGRYVVQKELNGRKHLVFVDELGNEVKETIQMMRALDVLMNLEKNVLPSPFLRKRVQMLTESFIQLHLIPEIKSGEKFKGWKTLYLKKFSDVLGNYYIFNKEILKEVSQIMGEAVAGWK